MSTPQDTSGQSATADDAPPDQKDPDVLVYCELPDGGGTIITTDTHCRVVLGGRVTGKPPPPTAVVTCVCPMGTVTTTATDCTEKLHGTVQTVTPPGG